MSSSKLGPCARRTRKGETCQAGPDGGPAEGVGTVGELPYCKDHLGAAKAVSKKRRDLGHGICSAPGCERPAAEPGGRCVECRAGIRAFSSSPSDATTTTGRGGDPFAKKSAAVYLVVFSPTGLIKLGKAVPWGVGTRVNEARKRHDENPAIRKRLEGRNSTRNAYNLILADGDPLLWGECQQIEHAAAGRLAVITGARSSSFNLEWLEHPAVSSVDWPKQFHHAVADALEFLGRTRSDAGPVEPA